MARASAFTFGVVYGNLKLKYLKVLFSIIFLFFENFLKIFFCLLLSDFEFFLGNYFVSVGDLGLHSQK